MELLELLGYGADGAALLLLIVVGFLYHKNVLLEKEVDHNKEAHDDLVNTIDKRFENRDNAIQQLDDKLDEVKSMVSRIEGFLSKRYNGEYK